MNDIIDHVARQDAALARQAMKAHEDRCAERWAENRNTLEEMRVELRAMTRKLDQASGGVRLLISVGGVASAAGAAIAWAVQHIKIGS